MSNKQEDILKIKIASLKKEIKSINPSSKTRIAEREKELKRLQNKLKNFDDEEGTDLDINEVELEILVEELRKTICMLGSTLRVMNASIKDYNLDNFLNYKLEDLKKMRSLKTVKKYLGIK